MNDGWVPDYTYIGKDGKAVLARDLEDQRDELVEAVGFYANGENWRMNGPLDVNSPRFDGQSRARAILAKIKGRDHE